MLARVFLQNEGLLFGKLGYEWRHDIDGQPTLAAPFFNGAVVANYEEQLLGVVPADLEHGLHFLKLSISFSHVFSQSGASWMPGELCMEVAVVLVDIDGIVQIATASRLQKTWQCKQTLCRPAARGKAVVHSAFVPLDGEFVSLCAGDDRQEHRAYVNVTTRPADMSGCLATGHGAQGSRIDGLPRADRVEFLGFGAFCGHGCGRRV